MKLGIIGTGMIVNEFLTIRPFLNGIEIAAICNTRWKEENIRNFADKHTIPYSFIHYNEFLNSEIDTVYVALPNNMHYQFAKEALEAGKHVIVEKPFTTTYEEAVSLYRLAKKKQLLLFEAITNQYLPNYRKIKELIPVLGDIKIVQCNYSQYSSRYDSFKEGNILPAFDPYYAGGALMDINVYNIHYIVGMFGKPKNIEYYPNIERGIDTSGILIMKYDTFVCTCIGAKDCRAPISNTIQGDKGCILQNSPTNSCLGFELLMNDGTRTNIDDNRYEHRMVNEFLEFADMISGEKIDKCYSMLEHTLTVCEILTIAREKAELAAR